LESDLGKSKLAGVQVAAVDERGIGCADCGGEEQRG